MKLYRITSEKYSNDLQGTGARIDGGRWNSIGVEMLYTSESQSLAILEKLVHVDKDILPDNQVLIELEVPDTISIAELDKNIVEDIEYMFYPTKGTSQVIGDSFIKNQENLILRVPSIISKNDYNYLLNPNHPDMKNVKISNKTKFTFDERLK
tara:strand:- start:42 stop:500 length:459 start_codon:yes stop_codon:yes gene_type:complete